MDDHDDMDLKRLGNIPTPAPKAGARERAVDAAVSAFEAAQPAAAEALEKKIEHPPQGFAALVRLISVSLDETWRLIMEKRVITGAVAATLLVAPVAIYHYQNNKLPADVRLPAGTEEKVTSTDLERREREAAKLRETQAKAQKSEQSASLDDSRLEAEVRAVEANEVDATAPPAPVTALGGADKSDSSDADVQQLAALPSPQPAMAPPKQQFAFDQASSNSAPAPTAGLRKQVAKKLKVRRAAQGAGNLADQYTVAPPEESGDKFAAFESNPVKSVAAEPVSTFSIDVDTASYAFVRRSLSQGHLPNPDAVRVEEMVNYFDYNYPGPESAEAPFKPSVAIYPTPWNKETKLLHIGLKGHDILAAQKPKSNLVFLLDVSGSMQSRDKLPLLKSAFRLLVNQLGENDSVSIVTYAGNAGTVLEPTKGSEKHKILAALDGLRSGGSTAGAQGIRQAYALAQQAFIKDGVNRVILATDGDFNVGITSIDKLKAYIAERRKSGIFLSVLGFGRGNYNDALMQTLAQNGNGNAAYIDTLNEARKVLVEEASSTLFPIAKDVKIQIEFNPARVSEYRLIGYETRALRREDFNNDKIDAGDIGSGHTVTAIYEMVPAGSSAKLIDDLRYQKPETPAADVKPAGPSDEFAFLKLRYKLPKEDVSKLITVPVTTAVEKPDAGALSTDMRFAAGVAAFGQKIRGSAYLGTYSYDDILNLTSGARGPDTFGYRAEFLNLVRLAKSLGTPKQ